MQIINNENILNEKIDADNVYIVTFCSLLSLILHIKLAIPKYPKLIFFHIISSTQVTHKKYLTIAIKNSEFNKI